MRLSAQYIQTDILLRDAGIHAIKAVKENANERKEPVSRCASEGKELLGTVKSEREGLKSV
jgi:hypothetical protein